MTPQTLSAHLKSLGLTAGGFARLIGVSKRTVERYLSGAVAVPGPVQMLASLLRCEQMMDGKPVPVRIALNGWSENKSLYSDKMA